MTDCPSRSELQEFLSDRLTPERDAEVLAHLENCGTCQLVLESLTAVVEGLATVVVGSASARTGKIGVAPTGSVAARPPVLPMRIGQYHLIRELGQGGMGAVYLAEQQTLKRPVAVKVIRYGINATTDEVARFRAEAEAVARLQHPNIVQIYDVGEAEGLPYLVLEFVAAGSLAQHLAGTPQPARPAAQLVETVARAVYAAHASGVIHRDLKPANILLQTGDGRLPSADWRDGGGVGKAVA